MFQVMMRTDPPLPPFGGGAGVFGGGAGVFGGAAGVSLTWIVTTFDGALAPWAFTATA